MSLKFNPILKAGLINGIGKEIYYKSHPLTKIELFQMALKEFFMWQIKTFGSRHKYNLYIIKRNGFESPKEYLDFWAESKGLANYSEYNRGYRKKRLLFLKEKGLCYECTKSLDNNNKRCNNCLKQHSLREKERRNNEI